MLGDVNASAWLLVVSLIHGAVLHFGVCEQPYCHCPKCLKLWLFNNPDIAFLASLVTRCNLARWLGLVLVKARVLIYSQNPSKKWLISHFGDTGTWAYCPV